MGMDFLLKSDALSIRACKTGKVIFTKLEFRIRCTLSAKMSGFESLSRTDSIFESSKDNSFASISLTNFFMVVFGFVSEISFSCRDSRNLFVNSGNSFSDWTLYFWYSLYPLSCNSSCFIIFLPAVVRISDTFEKILFSLALIYNCFKIFHRYLTLRLNVLLDFNYKKLVCK